MSHKKIYFLNSDGKFHILWRISQFLPLTVLLTLFLEKLPLFSKALDKVQALTTVPKGMGKVAKGVLFQQVTEYDDQNNRMQSLIY